MMGFCVVTTDYTNGRVVTSLSRVVTSLSYQPLTLVHVIAIVLSSFHVHVFPLTPLSLPCPRTHWLLPRSSHISVTLLLHSNQLLSRQIGQIEKYHPPTSIRGGGAMYIVIAIDCHFLVSISQP